MHQRKFVADRILDASSEESFPNANITIALLLPRVRDEGDVAAYFVSILFHLYSPVA